jgi:hypothetical protein
MRGRKTGIIAADAADVFEGVLLHRWPLTLAVVIGACLAAADAVAHPHVWVTMRTAVLYAPDGAVTGFRQDWTFDDMYSAFALTGINAQKKGQYTRAELQPLAQINVDYSRILLTSPMPGSTASGGKATSLLRRSITGSIMIPKRQN